MRTLRSKSGDDGGGGGGGRTAKPRINVTIDSEKIVLIEGDVPGVLGPSRAVWLASGGHAGVNLEAYVQPDGGGGTGRQAKRSIRCNYLVG